MTRGRKPGEVHLLDVPRDSLAGRHTIGTRDLDLDTMVARADGVTHMLTSSHSGNYLADVERIIG